MDRRREDVQRGRDDSKRREERPGGKGEPEKWVFVEFVNSKLFKIIGVGYRPFKIIGVGYRPLQGDSHLENIRGICESIRAPN